jgi:hypothetical protein
MSENKIRGEGVMRSAEGDAQSVNGRGQRSSAPRLSPELAELMHMLDSLEHHFITKTTDSEH